MQYGGFKATACIVTFGAVALSSVNSTIARGADATSAPESIYSALTEPSRLTFDDEFTTFTSSADGSIGWMTRYHYEGESARALPDNGESEFYSDPSTGVNPFDVKGGILRITAARASRNSNPYDLPYTSGIITTYKSFSQTYGYFEICARLPAGQGLWPAFWLLPIAMDYTSELDVFEVLGHTPAEMYFTTHDKTDGKWTGYIQKLKVADTSAGFHSYGVDWEPKTITLFIDGVAVATASTPSTMNSPMYMLVNLAVGSAGSWPGSPDETTQFPAVLEVDYVRAYATSSTNHVHGWNRIKSAHPACGGNSTLIREEKKP